MAPRRCVTALQNAVKSSLAKPQCRTFSRSAICGQNGGKSIAPFVCLCSQECGLGDLIDLQESSSPDLADLLQTIRSKIIIPNRLNKNQRRLIERKDYADNLENEPVHATVGGQRVRLQHLDKLKDVPARWESIKSAIELSQSKQDYENLFHLLRDMHSAGIPMKPFWQAKLTRNTQASGMLPVLMTGLRGVKETRLSLANPEVLHRTLWAIHAWAEDGKWKEEPIRVALHYAEEVIAMLEDPLHGGSPRLAENDPRTDPTITGVVLECAALLAHHHQGGKDESGKVALYAERVMSMFRSVGDEKVSAAQASNVS